MEFANKECLFLLLLIVPYIVWYLMYRKKSEPTMRMSDTFAFRYVSVSWKVRLMPVVPLLRIVAFVLLVIVLARPQTSNSWKDKWIDGIDIMLAMDVSTSMLAEDLKPNRIEAAKQVAAEFIAGRPNDNIGLTIFAGEAFTQCPMTVDHASLLNCAECADGYRCARTHTGWNGHWHGTGQCRESTERFKVKEQGSDTSYRWKQQYGGHFSTDSR